MRANESIGGGGRWLWLEQKNVPTMLYIFIVVIYVGTPEPEPRRRGNKRPCEKISKNGVVYYNIILYSSGRIYQSRQGRDFEVRIILGALKD